MMGMEKNVIHLIIFMRNTIKLKEKNILSV